MGTHVEWLDAKYTSVGVVEAGEEVLEDDEETEVREGHLAVYFASDEVVVLEGPPERVAQVLRLALNAVEERITEDDGEVLAKVMSLRSTLMADLFTLAMAGNDRRNGARTRAINAARRIHAAVKRYH